MAQDYPNKRFSSEAAQAIIKRALERTSSSGDVAFNDLAETAKELGIDPANLAAAIEEQEAVSELEGARNRWRIWRKRKFYQHLRAYIIVNSALTIFSLLGQEVWFLFPLIGWGIGLTFDFFAAFYPNDRDIERGTMAALKQIRKERERNNISFSQRDYQTARPEPFDGTNAKRQTDKTFTVNFEKGKIIIFKGDKRIEIGEK
ncbi:hypothetical protein MASR2M18_14190 [Ignavibacteria bacterium]|nr:2TM domain-containing protein [Bacteroidota bacterium]MCZ2132972.1 2TM domain-containing protein [Bacteroidota bacterium]